MLTDDPFVGHYHSQLGRMAISATGQAITSVLFADDAHELHPVSPSPLIAECIGQLEAYFAGQLRQFNLPLAPQGTEFQQKVWAELQKLSFGRTATYGDLAHRLGDPNLTRAVGTANCSNPIAIIIPCHRIIGADGSLTGYAGGLWRKQWLLRNESDQRELF
jgi:methylated-DNA-[protein]-cysteine S-methyltransferase